MATQLNLGYHDNPTYSFVLRQEVQEVVLVIEDRERHLQSSSVVSSPEQSKTHDSWEQIKTIIISLSIALFHNT